MLKIQIFSHKFGMLWENIFINSLLKEREYGYQNLEILLSQARLLI